MSNPIAKVSLYRLDGELRGIVLRTYEGAGLLPLGDHDVYAAPVTAANDQQNTQQPVARINTVGGYPDDSRHELELLVKHCHLSDGQLLYTAPPVPRVPDDYISQAREAAIEVFSGSCSATKDAIEYFAAELRAKLSAAQKPEGHQ